MAWENGPLNTTTNFLDAWHFNWFVVKPELSKAFQIIYANGWFISNAIPVVAYEAKNSLELRLCFINQPYVFCTRQWVVPFTSYWTFLIATVLNWMEKLKSRRETLCFWMNNNAAEFHVIFSLVHHLAAIQCNASFTVML